VLALGCQSGVFNLSGVFIFSLFYALSEGTVYDWTILPPPVWTMVKIFLERMIGPIAAEEDHTKHVCESTFAVYIFRN
jgi:hypothetical protein